MSGYGYLKANVSQLDCILEIIWVNASVFRQCRIKVGAIDAAALGPFVK